MKYNASKNNIKSIFLQKTLKPLTTLLQTSISIENKEYLCSNFVFLFLLQVTTKYIKKKNSKMSKNNFDLLQNLHH